MPLIFAYKIIDDINEISNNLIGLRLLIKTHFRFVGNGDVVVTSLEGVWSFGADIVSSPEFPPRPDFLKKSPSNMLVPDMFVSEKNQIKQ